MPEDGSWGRGYPEQAENLPIGARSSSGWPTVAPPLRRAWPVPILAERRLWTTPRTAGRSAEPRNGSKPRTEQPNEGKAPTQPRLNHTQNAFGTSTVPQSGPKLPSPPAGTAPLPKTKPNSPLRAEQSTLTVELPNPASCRRTIRPPMPFAPIPNSFPTPQNRIQTRPDDRRAVTLERNAERRKKTDRHPTPRTPAPHLPDRNPLHLRKPDLPRISTFALRTRIRAERTAGRNLCLNLRMIRKVGLNRADEERN